MKRYIKYKSGECIGDTCPDCGEAMFMKVVRVAPRKIFRFHFCLCEHGDKAHMDGALGRPTREQGEDTGYSMFDWDSYCNDDYDEIEAEDDWFSKEYANLLKHWRNKL